MRVILFFFSHSLVLFAAASPKRFDDHLSFVERRRGIVLGYPVRLAQVDLHMELTVVY